MKITLLCIGLTDKEELQSLIAEYHKRLQHYIPFTITEIPDLRKAAKTNTKNRKQVEGLGLLGAIQPSDHLILLDTSGNEYNSIAFSALLNKHMAGGLRHLIFAVGGSYGFSEDVYQRANARLSLSKMTFSHQMVRLFFVEQLYRAFTILRNEPYHHQ